MIKGFVQTYVLSMFGYSLAILSVSHKQDLKPFEKVCKKAAKVITGAKFSASGRDCQVLAGIQPADLQIKLGFLKVGERILRLEEGNQNKTCVEDQNRTERLTRTNFRRVFWKETGEVGKWPREELLIRYKITPTQRGYQKMKMVEKERRNIEQQRAKETIRRYRR